MNNLLDVEYFHFGTNNIRKELWLNLYMINEKYNYSKPLGGLWCSNQNAYNFCDWLTYKEEEEEKPYDYDIYVGNKTSSLVKFRDNVKLLSINNKNDFKNLKDSGMTVKLDTPIKMYGLLDYEYIYELPDYNKIKKLYDLLYINSYADRSLNQYSVNTMLAINPNTIEYFKPINCDYYTKEIISIGEKEYIKDLDSNYLELLKYLKEYLLKLNYDTKNNLLNAKEIADTLLDNKDITDRLPNDIDKKHALGVAITNINNDLQEEKKLVLHN